MKTRLFIFLSLGILLAWISAQRNFWDPGPSYLDTSLVEWLSEANEEGVAHSKYALKHIGPPAVPYILRNLRSNFSWPPATEETLYSRFWYSLPERLQDWIPEPGYPNEAVFHNSVQHLIHIGPNVLPTLNDLLNSRHPVVKACAIITIKEFGKMGYGGEIEIAGLIEAMDDDDEIIRYCAILGLHSFGAKSHLAADSLLNQLHLSANSRKKISTEELQYTIIETLGKIGAPASNAVPALVPFLKNGSTPIRLAAVTTLWKIQRNAGEVLPLLMNTYTNVPSFYQSAIHDIFAEMGPEAHAATPLLSENLSNQSEDMQISAARTLLKIDPSQSTNILQWLLSPNINSPRLKNLGRYAVLLKEMPILPDRGNLIELMGHQIPEVRSAAFEILSNLDSNNIPQSAEILNESRPSQ